MVGLTVTVTGWGRGAAVAWVVGCVPACVLTCVLANGGAGATAAGFFSACAFTAATSAGGITGLAGIVAPVGTCWTATTFTPGRATGATMAGIPNSSRARLR